MNALCYKIVFSKRLGALVAVGEHTSGQGKAAGTGVRTAAYPSSAVGATAGEFVGSLKAVFASVALTCFTATTIAAGPAANTLPTGYSVNNGNVAVSTSGANMTIKQTTDKASVNWQSFSIGSAASVNIQQNSASSVLLNRVVGNDPSQIFGKLTANGQVILINPNGIVFGKGGSVTASAFTASTFGMTEDDFNNGKRKFSRNGSTAGVTVEQGANISTTAPGGYVALIGASVDNQGAITTQGGAVVLAAGESAALLAAMTDNVGIPLSSKVRLELAPSTINASVENGGTVTTEGGQVLMRAAAVADAVASVTHTGTIDTTDAQGGGVDVLADGGQIRVSGSIKANSNNGTAGGDIYVGRDKDTNVLAAVGDASGAQLESKGGFVETSGAYLVTDNISVKAAEWLLDPSDITISNGNDTNVTVTSPGDITPNGGNGTSSIVKVKTIQDAINTGTNVTIRTTNDPDTTGAGNITIADKLTFKNTGLTNATLSLIADNGITQNTAATITTDLVNSTKLVHISMEAKGNYRGNNAESTNSKGITLNSSITTNGTVTLTGTSKDTTGVQSGPNFTWGVTNNSRSGVVFNNGAGITADNFQVTGTHTVAAGNSFGVNGVYMNGTVTFKATGNTDSNITGNSNAQGNFGAGVMVMDGAKVTLENQGTGVTTLKGSNTNTGGGNGVRIGATNNNSVINAIGRVTLGQQTANVNAPIFVRGILNADKNSVNQSGLRIVGQTEKNTAAVQLWDTNINAEGVNVVVDGITANSAGVYVQNSPNTTWKVNNLTVTGVAKTTKDSSGSGVVVQRYPNVLTVNASGNIDIQGTVEGKGNGRGLYFSNSGWGPQAPSLTAAGNITLRGNNRAAENNIQAAVDIVSGVQVNAGGNIVLQAETNNDRVTAINVTSAGNFANWTAASIPPTGALTGNMSLKSKSGDVLIQSNGGSIALNNSLTSTLENGSLKTLTEISGRNITIDNTGAGMATGAVAPGATGFTGTGGTQAASIANDGSGINSTTGAITKGAGKATGTRGISFADGRTITATGNLNIAGVSSNSTGVELSNAKVNVGAGNINIEGATSANNANGVWVVSELKTTGGGNITLTGTDTSTGSTSKGLRLGANIGDEKTGTVTLNGTSTKGDGIFQDAGTISSQKNISITGTGGVTGVNLAGTVTSLAGGSDFEKSNAIAIEGNGTLNGVSVNGAITNNSSNGVTKIKSAQGRLFLNGTITNAASASDVLVSAGNGSASSTAYIAATNVATITQNANSDVTLTSDGLGNVTPAKIVNNGTGNVVIAAGRLHTNGDGGNVETMQGNTITNASGKTYIYTGKAALTGKLSNLDNALATLSLSSDTGTSSTPVKQNADSNVMYPTVNSTLGIQNSTASAQVMFREKLAFDIDLTNTTLTKTYGETGTSNSGIVQLAKDTLTRNNTGNFSRTSSAGDIQISKAALIDSLNVKVKDAKYSSSSFLSAGTYTLEEVGGSTPLSNKYDVKINSGNATVAINQKPLTVSYTADNKVFDGTTAATVTSTMAGVVAGDQVALKHAAANFSDAAVANSKTVTVTGIQLNSNNANNDAANYKVVTNTSPTTGTANATPNATTATTTANITVVPPKPPVPVVPTDGNSRVKIPVGSANPFALASAEDLADDTCSANSVENCHCEESAVSQGVDICYEPKNAAKGSVR